MNTVGNEAARQKAFALAEKRYKHDEQTVQARQAAREQSMMLAELRAQHAEGAAGSRDVLRKQLATRRRLLNLLRDGPSSVPELAGATSMPAHEVLWYLAAMKKYGLVEEAGMDDRGDYYLYALSREAQP